MAMQAWGRPGKLRLTLQAALESMLPVSVLRWAAKARPFFPTLPTTAEAKPEEGSLLKALLQVGSKSFLQWGSGHTSSCNGT